MEKLVAKEQGEGLVKLMGKIVTLLCGNYIYTGQLARVNTDDVLLKNPAIVYEGGAWTDKEWKNAETLGIDELYVRTSFIESYGVFNKQ